MKNKESWRTTFPPKGESRAVRILYSLFLILPLAQEIRHTTDSVETVKAALAKGGAVLLDVREQSEWDAGHLESARFVPLSGLKDEAGREKLLEGVPKDKPVYVHCRSGARALTAGAILKGLGYDVRPLKAGYAELKKAGLK